MPRYIWHDASPPVALTLDLRVKVLTSDYEPVWHEGRPSPVQVFVHLSADDQLDPHVDVEIALIQMSQGEHLYRVLLYQGELLDKDIKDICWSQEKVYIYI